MDTVFTMIIKGEIPSVRIYEDDICIVILDINPVSPGHSLVISKQQIADAEDMPSSVLSHMINIAVKVSARMREKLGADATNIMINNGSAAGREVDHLHIHVVPRYKGDGKSMALAHVKYADGEMQKVGELLKI